MKVGDLKTYSSSKLDNVKSYGVEQFNRFAELAHLNAVLDVADSVVDKVLPAVETEQQQDETTPVVCILTRGSNILKPYVILSDSGLYWTGCPGRRSAQGSCNTSVYDWRQGQAKGIPDSYVEGRRYPETKPGCSGEAHVHC